MTEMERLRAAFEEAYAKRFRYPKGDPEVFARNGNGSYVYCRTESHFGIFMMGVESAFAPRPIEEAPKDGTRVILLGGTAFHGVIARWSKYLSRWQCDDGLFCSNPTHYMHLPSIPGVPIAEDDDEDEEEDSDE